MIRHISRHAVLQVICVGILCGFAGSSAQACVQSNRLTWGVSASLVENSQSLGQQPLVSLVLVLELQRKDSDVVADDAIQKVALQAFQQEMDVAKRNAIAVKSFEVAARCIACLMKGSYNVDFINASCFEELRRGSAAFSLSAEQQGCVFPVAKPQDLKLL